MPRVHIALALLLSMILPAYAANVLRIGISDSDAPPIVVISERDSRLIGGLSYDFGHLLASELGVRPAFVILSRKRVEPWIESGRVDIICNANPAWYGNAERLGWTHEIFPEIERIVGARTAPDIRQLDELAGHRIATIHGYSYPTLEALWAQGRAARVEEAHVDLMMKSLEKGLSDVAIVNDLAYSAWAHANARSAQTLKIHPLVLSSLPTQCAVAPNSPFTLARINQALDRLIRDGRLKTLLKTYQ